MAVIHVFAHSAIPSIASLWINSQSTKLDPSNLFFDGSANHPQPAGPFQIRQLSSQQTVSETLGPQRNSIQDCQLQPQLTAP